MKRKQGKPRSASITAATTEVRPTATSGGVSKSKRTLLKAGWVAPVILAVSLPQSSYAKNISGSKPGKPGKPGKP